MLYYSGKQGKDEQIETRPNLIQFTSPSTNRKAHQQQDHFEGEKEQQQSEGQKGRNQDKLDSRHMSCIVTDILSYAGYQHDHWYQEGYQEQENNG